MEVLTVWLCMETVSVPEILLPLSFPSTTTVVHRKEQHKKEKHDTPAISEHSHSL